LKESAGAGGGGPASGRDFDKLTLGIGEVEEDLGGHDAGMAGAGGWRLGAGGRGPGAGNSVGLVRQDSGITASDAMPDGEALVLVFVVGLGFEVIEERVEGAGAREGIVLGVEFMEEPLAVGAGADGEDVETSE
jgi:hypothetical protein